MNRHHRHYNGYCLKSQVLAAGGGPVQWLIISYLVYDKKNRSLVRSTHGTEESDNSKMNFDTPFSLFYLIFFYKLLNALV